MKRKTISVIALALCVLMMALSFAACGSKNPLVGTWESVEAPGTSYIFNKDGSGALDASGTTMNFTYTVKDDTVEITYEDTSTAIVNTFRIEGSTLSLTDKEYGTILTYTKK